MRKGIYLLPCAYLIRKNVSQEPLLDISSSLFYKDWLSCPCHRCKRDENINMRHFQQLWWKYAPQQAIKERERAILEATHPFWPVTEEWGRMNTYKDPLGREERGTKKGTFGCKRQNIVHLPVLTKNCIGGYSCLLVSCL